MSYINAIQKSNKVIVWERSASGRKAVTYPGIFEYYVPDPHGEITSIFGNKVSLCTFDSYWEFKTSLDDYKAYPVPLRYESDIGTEYKVLSENYYDVDPPKLNITLYDIEVDYDETIGFSSVENPYAPINAIALYHEWSGKQLVLAVPPPGWDSNGNDELYAMGEETGTEIRLFSTESELLLVFLDEIEDSDCISGWNSDFFDTPYICARIQKSLGDVFFKKMSFPEAAAPKYRLQQVFGVDRTTVDLGGRISYDYMELFKKFEMNGRPSYSLEAISNEVLPDLPKLTYTGSLAKLYKNDFVFFIRYNIRDTEVLRGFEEKLGYIQLASVLYHSSCGLPANIFGTIKLVDLALINHCHYNLGVVVPDHNKLKIDGGAFGAMVLHPQKGLHSWIGSIDITSLYPSSIRMNNISPEKLIGQMRGSLTDDDRGRHSAWDIIHRNSSTESVTMDYDDIDKYGETETHTGAEWREILFEHKWSISGYGTIFDQATPGMFPTVLHTWFKDRDVYKKKMNGAKKSAAAILEKYK